MFVLVFSVSLSMSALNSNASIQPQIQDAKQSAVTSEENAELTTGINLQSADTAKATSFFDRNKDTLNFWVQTVGVIGGLIGVFFLAYQIHLSVEVQKLANLQMLTTAHREAWSILLEHKELDRILDANADLVKKPISEKEKLVTNFFILHLNTSFQLMKAKMVRNIGELEGDVRDFFSYPIPRAVWNELKNYHDKELVKFIEAALSSNTSDGLVESSYYGNNACESRITNQT